MHLCLVVMMADINYLSNKTLVKQSWEVCTKQGRLQSGSTAPSNTFRQSLGFLWTGLWGTGSASMDVARGVCSEDQEHIPEHPGHISGLQEASGCGTWGCGFGVMMVVLSWWWDWMILKVSANLDDSGIWWFWDLFGHFWHSFGHFPVPGCSLMVPGHWLGTGEALSHLVTSERHRIWLFSGSSIHCENNNVISGGHQETLFTLLIQAETWKVQSPHETLG